MNDPKYSSLKTILIIVLIVIAGYFLYTTMTNRQADQSGSVLGQNGSGAMYVYGLATSGQNKVWKSIDGTTWNAIYSNMAPPPVNGTAAQLPGNIGFGGLVTAFQKLWIFDGNPVFNSNNGATWTSIPAPTWGPASLPYQVIKHGNAVFAFGGNNYNGNADGKKIWKSTDGIHWTLIQNNAPYLTAERAGIASFNGKLYLAGNLLNTGVWSSVDGITWTQITTTVPWQSREFAQLTNHNGTLWLTGGVAGNPLSDIWKSTDGITWTQVIANAPWGKINGVQVGRYSHCAFSFNSKLWVTGGRYFGSNTNYNDVWSSLDGTTWTQTGYIVNMDQMLYPSYGCAVK